MNNIYDRIRMIYLDSGLKQVDIAKKLHISESYVSKIIKGKRDKEKPTERFLHAIAKAFYVNIEWIKTGNGDMYAEDETGVPLAVSELEGLPYGTDPEVAQLVGMVAEIYKSGTDDDRAVIYGHIRRIHDKLQGRVHGESGGPDQPGFRQGEEEQSRSHHNKEEGRERGAA